MKRVVVVLCALGVLCGCGSSAEEQPKALPPVVVTGPAGSPGAGATPTASPTGAVPTGAAATAQPPTPATSASASTRADEDAQTASAQQFAKTWVKATDRAYQSLDVTELQSLSAPSCVSCQNYIHSVRHGAAVGETYRGGQTVILSAVAPPLENGETIVLVDVSVPETQVVNSDGVLTETVPALKRGTLNVTVRRTTGRWTVVEVTRS